MYKLIREKRKSITLTVDDTLQVVVKAPLYTPRSTIEEVIIKQKEWIDKVIKRKQQIMENDWFKQKKILYLGEYREVDIIYQSYGKNSVEYKNDKFYIYTLYLEEASIKKQMYRFIQQQAKIMLTELTNKYCDFLGCTYKAIAIRNQKTRWGSCSSKGNLSYNIKIMCAPLDKVEYIVLHEVMHIKHFNHSKAFWEAIKGVMPDYEEKKLYFKQYGQDLTI